MLKYFRGWKRRTGLLLLIVTSMLAALWIRSLSHYDVMLSSRCTLASCYGGIYCEHPGSPFNGKTTITSQKISPLDADYIDPRRCPWKWQLFGFRYGVTQEEQQSLVTGKIDLAVTKRYHLTYWPIVLVASFVSAWLVLSKNREAAPKMNVQTGT